MSHNNLPDDEKLLSAVSDVTWQLHAYDQYGKNQARAIKALAKRAPGYTAEFYKEIFELHLKLLIATIDAVKDAPLFIKPGQKYSEYTDVSINSVMDRLRSAFPGYPDEFLKNSIGMVIYWYYLR
jgi:hypothetical protein